MILLCLHGFNPDRYLNTSVVTVLAGEVEKDGVALLALYVSFQTSYLLVSDEEPIDEGVHLKALPEYPSVL